MTRPTLTDEQRDQIRQLMGEYPLVDVRGRPVPMVDLKPGDFDQLPVQHSIAVGTADFSEVIERVRRAVADAGYIVTLTVRPGDSVVATWGDRRSTEGKVVGETLPVRDERLFRLIATALLSSFAVGIALGTVGYLLFHSLVWPFVAYLIFFLPALLVVFAIGNLYDSDLVAVELRLPSPMGGGLGRASPAVPMILCFAAGSIRSRQGSMRGTNLRQVTKAHEGPSTRADLARVVEKYSRQDSLPLSSTTG